MEKVTKKIDTAVILPFFAKRRKIRISMARCQCSVFSFLIKSGKIKKTENTHKYIPFFRCFRLLRKTEKWKTNKNILVSDREDFSNF